MILLYLSCHPLVTRLHDHKPSVCTEYSSVTTAMCGQRPSPPTSQTTLVSLSVIPDTLDTCVEKKRLRISDPMTSYFRKHGQSMKLQEQGSSFQCGIAYRIEKLQSARLLALWRGMALLSPTSRVSWPIAPMPTGM